MKLFRNFLLVLLLLTVPVWAAPQQEQVDQKALMQNSIKFYRAGNFKKAVELLERYTRKWAEDPTGFYSLGLSYYECGQFQEALDSQRKCLQLCQTAQDRGQPVPQVLRRNATTAYEAAVQQRVYELMNDGRMDEALAQADSAIAFMPEGPGTHFAKGAVLFERWFQSENSEDRAQSKRSWEQARRLQPVSATGELLAGINAFENRDFPRARTHFDVALQMRPNNRYATLWLGLVEARLGNLDTALQHLQACLEQFPRNPMVHFYIGEVYNGQARREEAEEQFREAIRLNPDFALAHGTLGDMARHTGRLDMAIKEYGLAVQSRPNSFDYRLRLASILREAGRRDEALAEFERCREVPGVSPLNVARVDLERALILLEKGDRQAATEALPANEEALIQANQGSDPFHLRFPRYFLYRAYVGNNHAVRQDFIRKALDFPGAYSLELHADAFVAWAALESSRNQGLRALEMLHQAWRRTPSSSSRAAWLRERFETTRDEEVARTSKQRSSLGPLALIDPFKFSQRNAYLGRCLEVLQSVQLGASGDLVGVRPGSEKVVTLIPADLDSELPQLVKTAAREDQPVAPASPWERLEN